MTGQVVHVLLVEDDEVDSEAIVRSFQKHNFANPITIATNGEDALKVLRGEGRYERIPAPYLILLDINMPRMNGLEFLKILQSFYLEFLYLNQKFFWRKFHQAN